MGEENASRGPDFDWFQSDQLDVYVDAERAWKNTWAAHPETGDQVRELLESVIHSLEGLSSPKVEQLHEILRGWPQLWTWSVDWWYCKDAIDRIPEITTRFGKLEPILTRVTPSAEANLYLREASQCFLYGFFQGSTALSRAAMEAGLNDHLKRKLGSVPDVSLNQKVRQAARFSMISAPTEGMANEVIAAAGMVLHDSPTSGSLAFDTLSRARGGLKELYGEKEA